MIGKAFNDFDANVYGYYPIMTRIMITYFARLNSSNDEADKKMHDKLIYHMKTDLAEALISNRKMVNGKSMREILLPTNVTIRKYSNKLHYYWVDDGKKEKII